MRCLECGAGIAERAQVCGRCGVWAPVEYQLSVAEDGAADAAHDVAGGPASAAIRTDVGQQRPESASDPEVDGAELAEWVTTGEFSTTRLRPGYDIEEVDAFLGAIRDTFLGIREPSLTPEEIRAKQFSTTRLRLATTRRRLTPSSMRPNPGWQLRSVPGARPLSPSRSPG